MQQWGKMMAIESSATLPRQRRVGLGLILLLAGGGLLVVLLLMALWTSLITQRRLAKELERLRASGEPVTVEELEAFYEVPPPGRDTTKIWLTALAPLDTEQFRAEGKDLPFVGEAELSVLLPGEPWPRLDQAEQFLSKYQRSLDAMHRAARQGGLARFPLNFADGIAMGLPHANQLRAGARLLELEAVVHSHRRRPDAAVESVAAIFAAARSLEQEPVLVSQLVRMALDGVGCARVAWLLSTDLLDDGQLAKLDADLAAGDYQDSFRRALIGERAIGLRTFSDPGSLGPEYANLRFHPFPAGDQALYLQTMAELIAAAQKIGPARQMAVEQAEVRFKEAAGTTGGKLSHPLTFLLLPAIVPFAGAVRRHEAERNATRVAVAIERFRRSEGRLPATLDELVPRFFTVLPADPFNGLSLHYRVAAADYVVYSVGANGADDGGSTESQPLPADIVVRVPLRDLQGPAIKRN